MTNLLQPLLEKLTNVVPFFVTLVAVLIVLALARYVVQRRSAPVLGYNFKLQVVMLTLSVAGFILVVTALPIATSTKGQLLSLFGILLSGAIALSATTFLGNIMAGLMQRAVRSFRPGDFIRVGEHFGRVTERGLFHVEIQSEHRDLTTMPNLYLATNPVRVIRSSGTLVSADISLGYDVPRKRVRTLLNEAAEKAQLKDPLVLVQVLGDFSVTYRVAGLLTEVKHNISRRARLRSRVLDALHKGGFAAAGDHAVVAWRNMSPGVAGFAIVRQVMEAGKRMISRFVGDVQCSVRVENDAQMVVLHRLRPGHE